MKFYGNSNDQEARKSRATLSESGSEDLDTVLPERLFDEEVNMSRSRQFVMKCYRL